MASGGAAGAESSLAWGIRGVESVYVSWVRSMTGVCVVGNGAEGGGAGVGSPSAVLLPECWRSRHKPRQRISFKEVLPDGGVLLLSLGVPAPAAATVEREEVRCPFL